MKLEDRRMNCHGKIALALVATVSLVAAPIASAASGTWENTGGGLWDTDTNWVGNTIADGSGFTADFSTLDISGAVTVSLDSARTIGNLIFGDTDTSSVGSWVLDNNGNSANVLTLSGTDPTITVNNMGPGSLTNSTVTISAVISGTDGLVKDGNGTVAGQSSFARGVLVLSGANDYSGGTTISSGALRAANSSALGTGDVTVASGAQLQLHGGVNITNTININGANALFSTTGSGGTPNLSGIVNLQSDSGISLATNSGNARMTLSGTLNLNGFTLTTNTINVTPAITISGVINGNSSSGIRNTTNGVLRVSNDNSATYSGTTTLQLGVLELGSDGALGSGTFAFSPNNDQAATIRSLNTTARTIDTVVTIGAVPGTANANSRYIFGSNTTGDLTFTNTTDISLGSIQRRFGVSNAKTQFDAGFTGSAGIRKENAGTLVLNGVNTYTGDTEVVAGTLELTENGGMVFVIGASGTNNHIYGTGTVLLDGVFTFDLTGAGTTLDDSWLIVDVPSLASATFGSNFSVAGFDAISSTQWAKLINSTDAYLFDETTGILSVIVIPEPASLALLSVGGILMLWRRHKQ